MERGCGEDIQGMPASDSIHSIIEHSLSRKWCELHGPLNIHDLRRAYKSREKTTTQVCL